MKVSLDRKSELFAVSDLRISVEWIIWFSTNQKLGSDIDEDEYVLSVDRSLLSYAVQIQELFLKL